MPIAKTIRSGQVITPPKILLYGIDGIGKTRLAAEAPRPKFICSERGSGVLSFDAFKFTAADPFSGDVEYDVAQSWQDILDAVGWLYTEQHDYQTCVIDTIDMAEPLLHKAVCERFGQPRIDMDKGEFAFQRGYKAAAAEAMTLLAGLDALTVERNMMVIVLAHADVKRYDAPDHQAYDRYRIRVNEALSEKLRSWADCTLFANWRVNVVKDKEGFGKENTRGVGVGERVLYTEERPAFWAKNRYDLPPELPMPRGASWQTLQDAIAAGIQASRTQPVTQPANEPQPQETKA